MAEEIKAEIKQEVKEEKEQKPTLIDDAEKAAERLEKANLQLKELLDRQDKIAARDRLGGRTFTSQPAIVETEEQKAIKLINEVMKDTGLRPLKL